ncbi:MAG: cobalamin B12-binding domain-containing protein [Gemmatimonadaceae bacterium]|nr:cobalamin B12-binding domain-containing protein [Gemmatimonadaceae bacterium]
MKSHPAHPATARHPIAVAAERTGLSQDVLRVWERRYGAVQPARDTGGQRLYSSDDIERLTLLHAATRAGRSIGQVARLSTPELIALVDEDIAARAASAVRTSRVPSDAAPIVPASVAAGGAEDTVAAAFALTRAFEGAQLDALLRRTAARQGVSIFLESVAAPLLRHIGDEWHAGRITPAQEHLVSSTVHDIAAEALRAFPARDGAPRVVIATPAGDRHAIGAVLVGAAAAMEGWAVLSLGADLPAADIADAARAAGARLVAISVVLLDRARVLDELRTLRTLLPRDIPIVVGGAGATALATELTAAGIRVEGTLAGLVSELRRVHPPG